MEQLTRLQDNHGPLPIDLKSFIMLHPCFFYVYNKHKSFLARHFGNLVES